MRWQTSKVKISVRARRVSEAHRDVIGKNAIQPDWARIVFSGLSVIAVVVLSATKLVSVDVGALVCAIFLVLTDCISVEDAYSSVDGAMFLKWPCVYLPSFCSRRSRHDCHSVLVWSFCSH